MRDFMKKYSYNAVKLFVSQIAISLFGLTLAIACAKIGDAMKVISSICAVVFYLFMVYTSMWEVGSKDKFGIDYGKIAERPLTGLYIGLMANSLNLVLAVIITLCRTFPDGGTFSAIGGIAGSVAIFIEGMYSGLLTLKLNELPLNSFGVTYFIITIPAIAVSTVAYYLGTKDMRTSRIMIPETPEEAEIKRDKKKGKKKTDEL